MSPFDPKQPGPQQGVGFARPQPLAKGAPASEHVLPTLFGDGYGTYQARPENFALSFVGHTAALALLLWLLHTVAQSPIITPVNERPIMLSDYVMNVGKGGPSGGGGGDASKLKASAGTPPRAAKQQFAPPVVLAPQQSKLQVEPTVVADLKIPQSAQMGDPLSKLMAPSNGIGVGGGIGSGDGGGVGSGHGGPGVGPGYFHLGESGVSAPNCGYRPDPEFSEEARKAKYQGVVGLNVVIGTDGRVHNAHVIKTLGMGLDEKAIEGVNLWKCDPGHKDGRPVAVVVYVEVDFHLY